MEYSSLPHLARVGQRSDKCPAEPANIVRTQPTRAVPSDVKPRLTKEQYDILEAEFQVRLGPSMSTKKDFAHQFGVPLERINNWFQNRRARAKPEERIKKIEEQLKKIEEQIKKLEPKGLNAPRMPASLPPNSIQHHPDSPVSRLPHQVVPDFHEQKYDFSALYSFVDVESPPPAEPESPSVEIGSPISLRALSPDSSVATLETEQFKENTGTQGLKPNSTSRSPMFSGWTITGRDVAVDYIRSSPNAPPNRADHQASTTREGSGKESDDLRAGALPHDADDMDQLSDSPFDTDGNSFIERTTSEAGSTELSTCSGSLFRERSLETPERDQSVLPVLDATRRDIVDRIMSEFMAHMRVTAGLRRRTGHTESGSSHPEALPSPDLSNQGICRGEKRRRGQHTNEEPSNDSPDEGGPPKRQTVSSSSSGLSLKFACPYFQRNPERNARYRSCAGPGWTSVHRVKEHIYRRHISPISCRRCHATFITESQLTDHQRQLQVCEVENAEFPKSLSPEQERKLRSRKKSGLSEEEKWREMYRILFPDEDDWLMPSPYYESQQVQPGLDEHLSHYDRYLLRELPQLVRGRLEVAALEESSSLEARLRNIIVDIVRTSQAELARSYRERHSPAVPALEFSYPSSDSNGAGAVLSTSFDFESFTMPLSIQQRQTSSTDQIYTSNLSISPTSARLSNESFDLFHFNDFGQPTQSPERMCIPQDTIDHLFAAENNECAYFDPHDHPQVSLQDQSSRSVLTLRSGNLAS